MVAGSSKMVVVLAAFCLMSVLLAAVPIQSQSGIAEYDPWMDINDDGIIDIFDLTALALCFGTEGEPMNKTELLLSLLSQMENLSARVELEVANLTTTLAEHEARIAALETKLQSLFIDGSITISNSKLGELAGGMVQTTCENGLLWLMGSDAPGDMSIDASRVTTDLGVEAGTPVNFTECLFVKNDNATGLFSITFNVNRAVSGSDFTTCRMHIYENSTSTWKYVDTLNLIDGIDTCSWSLAAGNYLRVAFEIDAATGASGTTPFDIQVRYN